MNNTYFSKNIEKANSFEIETIINHLKENGRKLTTIQWHNDDDSLYIVSSLPEWTINPSDEGLIWYYEPADQLLKDIEVQLK